MQAIVETGGKQYSVTKGAKILVNKLSEKTGSHITLDRVLFVSGDKNAIGTPYVSGAKVEAKILSTSKQDKVVVFKYKRRKGYHKKQGHRQEMTLLQIENIAA